MRGLLDSALTLLLRGLVEYILAFMAAFGLLDSILLPPAGLRVLISWLDIAAWALGLM